MQPNSTRLRLAALLGLSAIVLGSLGAHGKVHDMVVAAGAFENWKTAVGYHLPHSVLLVVLALVGSLGGKRGAAAWTSLFIGVLLFSGSLYAHALTQVKWLVYVTPIGGAGMILGWFLLLCARWQPRH